MERGDDSRHTVTDSAACTSDLDPVCTTAVFVMTHDQPMTPPMCNEPHTSEGGGETIEAIWFRLRFMNRRLTKVSKYLSFVLRHHPEAIGLKLDTDRWANVDELIAKANTSGKSITLAQVRDVVTLDEQKMFVFSDDGSRIRSN